MLVAKIKDLNKNIDYNVYIINYQNKLSFRVKCIDNEKYYYLSKFETDILFSKLFNYDKKYIGKFEGYNVYIDGANNKHYFKDNKENIEMFYKYNGITALSYLFNRKNDSNDISKSFYIENKNDNSRLILTCIILFFYSAYFGGYIKENTVNSNNVSIGEYISSDLIAVYNYINPMDSNEIVEKINNSNGLNENEKKFLINEELFNDVLNIADRKRSEELREKLSNITKKYYNEKELIENENTSGFYNPLEPNIIHIKNVKNDTNGTLSHEFVHLLQDNNPYYFIREAVAELIVEEYYGEKANSYLEEIQYVKILMEIIGPKPIFECCFKGNTTIFENRIKSLLNEEDAEELLKLFTTKPLNCENKEEVYQKMYYLLSKMYNGNILEDSLINAIRLLPEYVNRGYFNINYIEECNNKDSYVYDTLKVEDAVNCGLIKIECSAVKTDKLTIEEFLLTGGNPRNINYSSLPNYYYKDKYVINSKTNQKYSLQDAIELGFIFDVEFFKQLTLTDLTLEETINYENTKDWCGHIRIIDADSNNVKHFEIPYFLYNKDEGNVPIVNVIIKKKIEPINEKFPEQFEEKNTLINFKR